MFRKLLRVNAAAFIGLHVLALATPFIADLTWTAAALFAATYILRTFGLTAGFHRYFAHRAYKTSRPFAFVLGWLGCSAVQKGPLWWAGTHREHHRCSDKECDPHSPLHGIFNCHVGWVLFPTDDLDLQKGIPDFYKHPEIRWLEKHHWIPPIVMALGCYLMGGIPGLLWGFIVCTVVVYHGTFMVNSVCHLWGSRRFATSDMSRNNPLVAIITFGEGWHNNHHHQMDTASQGMKWWEADISYYILWLLSWPRIVWDLRQYREEKPKAAGKPKLVAQTS